MADKSVAHIGMAALIACALAACGQKGPLYLPDAPSDVVTRPAATPPPAENTAGAEFTADPGFATGAAIARSRSHRARGNAAGR